MSWYVLFGIYSLCTFLEKQKMLKGKWNFRTRRFILFIYFQWASIVFWATIIAL